MTLTEKFLRSLPSLLKKGWRVKKQRGGKIRFAPPNSRNFCHCPLTAAAAEKGAPSGVDLVDTLRALIFLRSHGFPRLQHWSIINVADSRCELLSFDPIQAKRRRWLLKRLALQADSRSEAL